MGEAGSWDREEEVLMKHFARVLNDSWNKTQNLPFSSQLPKYCGITHFWYLKKKFRCCQMCIPLGLNEMMLDLSMTTKPASALSKHTHIISLEGSCFLLESPFRTWQGFFPLPVLAQSVLYAGLAASIGFYLMTWTEKNSLDSLPVGLISTTQTRWTHEAPKVGK